MDNECALSDSPWRIFMPHYKMKGLLMRRGDPSDDPENLTESILCWIMYMDFREHAFL